METTVVLGRFSESSPALNQIFKSYPGLALPKEHWSAVLSIVKGLPKDSSKASFQMPGLEFTISFDGVEFLLTVQIQIQTRETRKLWENLEHLYPSE